MQLCETDICIINTVNVPATLEPIRVLSILYYPLSNEANWLATGHRLFSNCFDPLVE